MNTSAKKGSATGTETLCAVLLCRFHCKPAGTDLIAECTGVEKPYTVDFASPPIESIHPAEGFDVPDQRSRILVFLRVDQYSPFIA